MTDRALTIYCIAIGGTGMAPLACLLQELGHRVRGADGPIYPPMSTLLEAAGIRPLVGFSAAHLDPAVPEGLPDLVVVGNAVPRSNAEAVQAEQLGLERLSMPEAVARFLLARRRPLVVAGTHGKTTTTTLAAWVLSQAGRDPGYLIGGMPKNLPASFRLGGGDRFVIEGDEYNAAYFDRGPKFLHYQPETLILNSVDYDHADLYPSPEALRDAYRRLVELLPPTGLLVAWGDSPEVREVAKSAPCPVAFFGFDTGNDLRPDGGAAGVADGPGGARFSLAEVGEIALGVSGRHNVLNALAVWAVARRDGLDPRTVAAAFAAFRGTARRLEELGTSAGVTVVDDFAHHPTAVAATLDALAQRYPGRRRVVLFEPRSLTAGRSFFHDAYLEAFGGADRVLFAPIFHAGRLSDEERLDVAALVRDLGTAGLAATACSTNDELLALALHEAAPGSVFVTMSSGSFDGLPGKLLAGLSRSV